MGIKKKVEVKPKRKKKSDTLMGSYTPKPNETKHMIWCVKYGIKMYPVPTTQGLPSSWFIDIDIDGVIRRSPKSYEETDIWAKIYELYGFYYKKYANI
jgi:hypothetical protein